MSHQIGKQQQRKKNQDCNHKLNSMNAEYLL